MDFTGTLKDISIDWETGKNKVTFLLNEKDSAQQIETLRNAEMLDIKVSKHTKKRSINANNLLWNCLGEIAAVLRTDKWEVYLQMLKRYGKYTYICVKPNVVEAMKAQWRECEVIGEMEINGKKAVQLLCYFGSSLMNTKEFSVLLDGVISEMRELGLQPPASGDMKRALEQWSEKHG